MSCPCPPQPYPSLAFGGGDLFPGPGAGMYPTSLRGYEIIDVAKDALERQFPGVVSCVDILAMAARDAVFFAGGPVYEMPKGRKDGRRSKIEDTINLHAPTLNNSELIRMFAQLGFTAQEMVALSGRWTTKALPFYEGQLRVILTKCFKILSWEFCVQNIDGGVPTFPPTRKLTAAETHLFLKWFEQFPEFIANPFYIAGESYAGIYIPTLTSDVVKVKRLYCTGNPMPLVNIMHRFVLRNRCLRHRLKPMQIIVIISIAFISIAVETDA
ncbi:hypothetical protein DH2020_022797 [Rehmannia glutinosa]|uniref:peroxidase n=1 Tax=Rehmannia glutinosa TaxID=99300 RepID=A0ABR0W5Z1_REHGL